MYPFQNQQQQQQQQHVPLPPSQQTHYQLRYPPAMLPPNHAAAAAAAATMGQPPPFQPPPATGQAHPQHPLQQQAMYQYHMAAPHPSTFPPHPSNIYIASSSLQQHAQAPQQLPSGGQNGIVSGGHPSLLGGANIHPGIKPSQRESVDKLVMQISNPKQQITPELVYERRLFFERLVMLNEQHGEVLSGPPQVSKSPVDLYSLYYAVKLRGGFEKTIRDKIWKNLCVDANTEMQQSSAAGFQLRKHYQKYLLRLECLETGQNIKELVEFAEKQKKKKKEKEIIPPTAATPIPTAGGPGTPSSSTSSSIAGKEEQQQQIKGEQQQPQRPSPFGSVVNAYPPTQGYSFQPAPGDFGASPAAGYPPPPQHFGPGGQYLPSSQWNAYQQQMFLQQRMRGPQQPSPTNPSTVSGKQQQAEDEHQQLQQQQGRIIPSSTSSSRLSSTPAPPDAQQQNRAPSTVTTDYQQQQQQNESSKRVDGCEIDGGGGDTVQKEAKGGSNNLSTSNASTYPPNAMGNPPNAIPPSSGSYYQHQIPHPSLYVPRFSPGSLPSSSDYAQGMYGGTPRMPQQPQVWSPYGGMQNPAAVVRYHHQQPPTVGTPINRFSHPYSQQSTSQQQPNMPIGAVNSPQLLAASQPQLHPQSSGKHHSKGRNAGPGMLPIAPSVPVAAYTNPQPPQQFPAWFGSSTLSAQQPPFGPYTLEAQAITHVQQQQSQIQQQRYRRPKVYARDLQGVTPSRIIMALRSALHVETCWALNALNIQLYDDTTPNCYPSFSQTPEFLNLLVEHFAAVLSLLFPKNFDENLLNFSSSKILTKRNSLTTKNSKNLTTNQPKIEPVSLMVRPPPLYPSPSTSFANIGTNNVSTTTPNFTLVSRLGRQVKLDMTTEIPPELVLQLEKTENEETFNDEREEQNQNLEYSKTTWRTAFIERIRQSMLDHINSRQSLSKLAPRFKKEKNEENNLENEEKENLEEEKFNKDSVKKEKVEEENGENENKKNEDDSTTKTKIPFFYRKPLQWENWDRYSMDECSLISRQPVLCNQRSITSSVSSAALTQELIDRCLALSNIFRGFSFLGEQKVLSQHEGLLRLLAAILMLHCSDQSRKRTPGEAPRQFSFPRPPPEESIKTEPGDISKSVVSSTSNASTVSAVPAEKDTQEKWLLEVANQLRDDAFTILAHISPQLDLYEVDSEISFPIFDALLHWSVCTDLAARDPLPPFGAISPKHYVLEIFCKMSVLERNIDLLLATGPWSRIEEFVRQLCSLICEEPPVREFAIVILNALCAASEPVCHVVTDETSLLDHLVSFLEAADANMTQIAQHQGIHALRENPEIIGTSVGMLRRSTLIMTHIVRHEQCRKHFQRLQHRLLQFTVSHFMDSRVAAMVSDILYEMQKGENGGGTGGDPNNEELVTLTTNKRTEKNIGDEQQEQQKSSPKLLNGDESINEGGGNSNNSSNNNNNNCGVGGYGHQMDFSKQKMEFQSSTRHFSLNSSDELTSALTLAAPSSIYSTSYSSIPHHHHSTSTTALRALYNGGTENCYSNKNTSETPTENKGIKIIPSTQQNGCDPWMYKNENNIINNSTTTTTNNETPIPKKRGRKRPTATTTNTSETSSPKKSWSQKRQTNKKVSENPAMDNSSTDNNTSVN
ncbi:unnamed protein product [Meloidogyne enterolobii]|uniref:Uncharacterized protein n=1 Tax=Meloidogyne enterolobii TaxID=390850 RepID=A0ACB0ZAZ1_MELEN